MRTVIAGTIALAMAACAAASHAQQPVQNINPYRHGNLAAAQSLSAQAFDRLTQAQIDNSYDLGGHVGRAKALLRQANIEIKLAAQYANQR